MGELRRHGPAKVVTEGDAASVADGISNDPVANVVFFFSSFFT